MKNLILILSLVFVGIYGCNPEEPVVNTQKSKLFGTWVSSFKSDFDTIGIKIIMDENYKYILGNSYFYSNITIDTQNIIKQELSRSGVVKGEFNSPNFNLKFDQSPIIPIQGNLENDTTISASITIDNLYNSRKLVYQMIFYKK